MNKLLLLLIMLYQRHLSPRKGYRCAYSVLYQTQGCWEQSKRLFNRKVLLQAGVRYVSVLQIADLQHRQSGRSKT